MPRRAAVACINTTQDLDSAQDVEFMFDHLKSVNRGCAIVKRLLPRYQKKKRVDPDDKVVKYSTWRLVDDEEQEHFRELTVLEQLKGDYEIVREYGDFQKIVAE